MAQLRRQLWPAPRRIQSPSSGCRVCAETGVNEWHQVPSTSNPGRQSAGCFPQAGSTTWALPTGEREGTSLICRERA